MTLKSRHGTVPLLCPTSEAVPPEVLQAKAEEMWAISGGVWGTPPGIPLESYDAMCEENRKYNPYGARCASKETNLWQN